MPLDVAAAAAAAAALAPSTPLTLRRSTVSLTSAAQWSVAAWREAMKAQGWPVMYITAPADFPNGRVPMLVARVSARPLVYEMPPAPVTLAEQREQGRDANAIALGNFVEKLESAAKSAGDFGKYALLAAGLLAVVLLARRT